jgi:putative PIN family toxin of toxin-antitoxin system
VHAVVDTNVLVSGLLGADGPPGQVVMAIATDRIRPVVCADIMIEYRDVLTRSRLRIRSDRVAELLKLIEQTADWITVPAFTGLPPLPDPDDWTFFAAARVAACPLITGNVRHFPADMGVRVMTAREWVEVTR